MNRRLFSLLLLVTAACLWLGASCGIERRIADKMDDIQDDLWKSAGEFNRLVSWGYYDEASAMVVSERRADFLMEVELLRSHVTMEGYKISLGQVSSAPFPRLRGEVVHQPKPLDPPEAMTPTPEPTPEPEDEEKPKEDLKMPKKFYAMVLVRFINMSIKPSNRVYSPLLRQYWVWENDEWMVDPEIRQLMDIGKPAAAGSAPPPDQPRVPGP